MPELRLLSVSRIGVAAAILTVTTLLLAVFRRRRDSSTDQLLPRRKDRCIPEAQSAEAVVAPECKVGPQDVAPDPTPGSQNEFVGDSPSDGTCKLKGDDVVPHHDISREQSLMRENRGDRPSDVTCLPPKSQEELGDIILDHLERIDTDFPGGDYLTFLRGRDDAELVMDSSGHRWDVRHLVKQHVQSFCEKVKPSRVQCLMSTDSVQLDKLGLDSFDALLVARAAQLRNRGMQFLILNGNGMMGAQGAVHLSRLLSDPVGPLQSLLVGGCGFGDAGLIALARALETNATLQLLDARQNLATDAAAVALAKMLGKNCTLESLYLNNDTWCKAEVRNQIGDEGAMALITAMSLRQASLKVSLIGNSVSDAARDEISKILPRRLRV